MTKDLPSPELLRKLLRYEPETGKLFWLHRPIDFFKRTSRGKAWNTRFAGKEALSAKTGGGYLHGYVFGKKVMAHRAIWAIVYGVWPDSEIDHINGLPDDNRLENLRDVSPSENSRNRKMQSNNSSGYNGVSWCKIYSKWRSSIKINKKRQHLGYFADIKDAVSVRILAEKGQGFTERHGK